MFDPRRNRNNYVTICQRLVAEARERGLVVGPDVSPTAPAREKTEPDVVTRLTPMPRKLLLGMRAGAHLTEQRGEPFRLLSAHHCEQLSHRRVAPLVKRGFIERGEALPPKHMLSMPSWAWRITDAGRVWLERNT